MNRYLIFGGDSYYARGGGNDFLGATDHIKVARGIAEKHIGERIASGHLYIDIDWTHIFDCASHKVIERFGTRPYGDDPEDAPEEDRVS